MNKKTEYAFPCDSVHMAEPVTAGMTLRDYFAAKAMQAYCSQYDYSEESPEVTAEYSYRIADAMLKAREQ